MALTGDLKLCCTVHEPERGKGVRCWLESRDAKQGSGHPLFGISMVQKQWVRLKVRHTELGSGLGHWHPL
jgi:hypothetical protein